MEYYVWFFIIAVVFTKFGHWWGSHVDVNFVVDVTVDKLIKDGYLRWRKNNKGEVEILKYDETS